MKNHYFRISKNGYPIHSIRFANDIALQAESEEELSLMLHKLDLSLDKLKLKMNTKNTKFMVVNKVIIIANITLNNVQIQQVNGLCYLGSLITDYNKATKEVKRRITLEKQDFEKKWTFLTKKHLEYNIKKEVYKNIHILYSIVWM